MGKHKDKKNSPKRKLLALEHKYPQAFEILIFISRASIPVVLPDEVYTCWKEFGIAFAHPEKKNCFLVNTKYLELIREEFCETEEYLREAVERAWEDDWQSTLEVFNAVNFGAEISQNAGLAMQFYHLTYKMGDKFYPHALLETIMTEQKNKPE